MKLAILSVASVLSITLACAAAEAPVPAATAAAPEPSAIVIYEQPNFQGRSLTINQATPDLAPFNFNDRVASFAIKGANDWVLCEHRNYSGRCVRVQARAQDLKLLQIAGRVSSLYAAPAAPAAPQ